MTYNMTGVRRQLKLKLRNCLLTGNLPTQRHIMCKRPGRMTGSQGSRFSGRVPNVSHDEALRVQALKAELPTDAAILTLLSYSRHRDKYSPHAVITLHQRCLFSGN